MAPAQARPNPIVFWSALGSCAVMVIGGLGPWAKLGSLITLNGSDRDGGFLIAFGIAGGILLAVHYLASGLPSWPTIVAAVLGVIGVIIVIADINDINQKSDLVGGSLTLSWGIIADLIGSIALGATGILLAAQAPDRRAGAPTSSSSAWVASPSQYSAPTLPPAGWYPDPGTGSGFRYWDGARWTEHVHDPESPAPPAPADHA